MVIALPLTCWRGRNSVFWSGIHIAVAVRCNPPVVGKEMKYRIAAPVSKSNRYASTQAMPTVNQIQRLRRALEV